MRYRVLGKTLLALAIAAGVTVVSTTAALAKAGTAGKTFTLVVLPDTQLAVQNKPTLFTAQTDWILRKRTEADIRFVIHVGDLVEWPSRPTDWQRATSAMHRLNGRVPYAISIGNHDMDAWACTPPATCKPYDHIAVDRRATRFNANFPRQLFQQWPSFGGSYPRDGVDNTYFQFSGGGLRWLVVSLKYNPTDAELAWAGRVIKRHRQHRIIINTHEYQQGVERSEIGERIWNTLVRRHRNIRIVLSGHYTTAGTRIDRGDHGNEVYQIQSDYQDYSLARVNENSYLRVMTFDTRAGTIGVKTYSPYCETSRQCPAYKTDASNQFTLTGLKLGNDRRRQNR